MIKKVNFWEAVQWLKDNELLVKSDLNYLRFSKERYSEPGKYIVKLPKFNDSDIYLVMWGDYGLCLYQPYSISIPEVLKSEIDGKYILGAWIITEQ